MAIYKSGEALIDLLNAHGVDRVFINPGYEYLGILSDFASAREEGKKSPRLVLCLDESVAASAAHGNYMITGRPQVVMVHSELGLFQLGGNIQNLQWGRVPSLILAGYHDQVQRTIWNGQPYDQGSIVRNNVKYDRQLTGDEDLHEVLTDAFRIACTEPMGPVYLCFPLSYLYKEIGKPAAPLVPGKPDALPAPDTGALSEMADILLEAKNPLLVSGYAGRYSENVEALIKLAETLGAPVVSSGSRMNFPGDHPLSLGMEQGRASQKEEGGFAGADAILVVDYDVQYVGIPSLKPGARILHIDVDPLTQGRLLWGRGADMFMKADSREAVPALEKLLKKKMGAEKKAEYEERYRRIASANEEDRKAMHEAAQNQADSGALSPDYVCCCLNQLIDEDAIFVNHTISHAASVAEQIVRTKPGTWFGCPGGAIGWATGAAIGAAAAAPGKLVAAAMTDGGFVWGCPTAALWTAVNYGFPFLAVIFNNNGYSAIRNGQLSIYGIDNPSEEFVAGSAVDFQLNYAIIAQGAGAFGSTVARPEEAVPALRDAIAAVRGGRPAVVDIRLP